ncbi:HEAT repeat domain-containing protein [Myxococcus stipitatus]|uniref:HEAT repeat domain-containing protein n=1 Tax=Myxococcus stipitatus TaxID=83455 RepID=UPI003144F26A
MSRPEHGEEGSTEALIQVALSGDEDDERAWEAIWTLRRRATREVMDAAIQLLGDSSAKARGRGADVLGQLGAGRPVFSAERGDALLELLRRESEPRVLLSAGVALGHLVEPRALSALIRLASHPSAEARCGAVHGLAVLDSPESVEALIQLSADEDRDVRDWATFALGTLREECDTPQLRDALAARLGDEDWEIASEALVGLAIRQDPRAVEPVRAALSGDRVTVYVLEAAAALGTPDFHPLLLALRDAGGPADGYFSKVLDEVIARFEQK